PKSGVRQWESSISYGGDRTAVTPPAGGTPTVTVNDARGHMTELRQYRGAAPTGTYDATRYTYTARGDLATVTDAAGNVWRYTYDQRGRKVKDEDPDKGTSTFTYDDAGQIQT